MAAARKKKSNTKRPSKVSPTEETGVRWPTQKELFDAAIELAKGKEFHRDEANHFVRKSLWLWLESDRTANLDNRHEYLEPRIEDYSKNEEGRTQFLIEAQEFSDNQSSIFKDVSMPKEYPLDFATFLACLFPTRSTDDRVSLYKDYLRQSVRASRHQAGGGAGDISSIPMPTSSEITKLFDRDKKDIGIQSEGEFRRRARWILEWYHDYLITSKAERSKKATEARHAKQRKKTNRPSSLKTQSW